MTKNVRQHVTLDHIDIDILNILQRNARISNQDLSAQVGIAPSTCINRVRALHEQGIITGHRATINPEPLGYTLQVLISITLRQGARQRIADFSKELQQLPEVTQVFFLGGVEDFIIHLVAADAHHVREFVVKHLSAHPSVATTKTSIVFEHRAAPLSLTAQPHS